MGWGNNMDMKWKMIYGYDTIPLMLMANMEIACLLTRYEFGCTRSFRSSLCIFLFFSFSFKEFMAVICDVCDVCDVMCISIIWMIFLLSCGVPTDLRIVYAWF